MEYTIQQFGKLAGITTRTLRYYDEIGLLKPARINSSGYRIYGHEQVERLQQILLYRQMGIDLETIQSMINSEGYDEISALKEHLVSLLAQRQQLDLLISNVQKTIDCREGSVTMKDDERFIGLKKKLLEENEEKYGKEIRKKYGEDTVKASNERFMNMTKEQYETFEKLGQEILDTLEQAFATGDPGGELGQKTAELHKQWLSFTWGSYNKEAHANLARMYVADERFTAYYDKKQPGMAEFLRDAIVIYTDRMK